MGFVVNTVSAAFRPVERAVRSAVHNPINAIPAAVGIATGNSWLAGAAAGATTAANGGNTSQILGSAAMTGLGAGAGSMLGNTPMYAARYLGGSAAVQSGLTGIGSFLGTNTYQRIQDQQRMSFNAPSVLSTPSMEEMKNRAILATRQVFGDHGLYSGYGISSKYMKKLRKKRPKYGYIEWKDLVRSRE